MAEARKENIETSRHTVFGRLWAFGLLTLIASSWPLWFGFGDTAFPAVPLLGMKDSDGDFLQSLGSMTSLTLVLGLAGVIFFRKPPKLCWIVISGSLFSSFMSDQHRIQPWAYQSFLYASMFSLMPERLWPRWILPLVVSIYAYSALGKFDTQFFNTVGSEFTQFMIEWIPNDFFISRTPFIIGLLPSAELAIAALICFRKTRRYGSIAAIGMHFTLIIVLGPWGKNHSAGVLIWNVMLIIQHVYLVFCLTYSETPPTDDDQGSSKKLGHFVVTTLWLTALIAPCLERTGYWDHWTSWSLYSPHTSRARIEIHQSAISILTESQQSALMKDHDGDQWRELDLSEWSLKVRKVPIYPQARYQLGLASQLAASLNLSDALRVKLQSVSDRRTGNRNEQLLLNEKEIEQALQAFWFHSR